MLGSDIRELVIVKLEEHTPFGDKSGETLLAAGGGDLLNEVKPVYSYIDASLEEAANEALKVIPVERLTPIATTFSGSAVVDTNDNQIGTIAKPTGWIRLHTLQMAGWSRPVHEVVYHDNPLYNEQFDIYSRGNAKKPVVTDDGALLHYYSQPESATPGAIVTCKYIAKFATTTDYPLDVAEVIALSAATKIYTIYGQGDQLALLTKDIESVFSTMKI